MLAGETMIVEPKWLLLPAAGSRASVPSASQRWPTVLALGTFNALSITFLEQSETLHAEDLFRRGLSMSFRYTRALKSGGPSFHPVESMYRGTQSSTCSRTLIWGVNDSEYSQELPEQNGEPGHWSQDSSKTLKEESWVDPPSAAAYLIGTAAGTEGGNGSEAKRTNWLLG